MLGTVFALHAVVIAFFLFQRSASPAAEVKPRSIALVSIAAERPAAAKPPPPALPAKLADTFEPVVEFSIPSETESDAPAGASGACSTTDVVLTGLRLDPIAVDAIRRAPPEMRSVADAVVIWNEGWNPATVALDSPLVSVRANLERSLATVPQHCLDEPVAGPRLLPIPDASGTTTIFLVLGSGTWTWRALLVPSAIPGSGGAGHFAGEQ